MKKQIIRENKPLRFLVTGGCGFIGSALVRYLLDHTEHEVLNLDRMTYAASPLTLKSHENHPRYTFKNIDIAHKQHVHEAVFHFQPDVVVNIAAETHVDNSIANGDAFLHSNVQGTYSLLTACLHYWRLLSEARQEKFRYHQLSTDEVFGSADQGQFFNEKSPYAPNSPYSASKASADFLVRSWNKTHGLPTTISYCGNNYGPYQFPEKLIPRMIRHALTGQKLPVYGQGQNIREWLHVDDHIDALMRILLHGQAGETYAIGSGCARTNIYVVEQICTHLDRIAPTKKLGAYNELIEYVTDRPGHDLRYALDTTKITETLGWRPSINFEEGLEKTIQWYLENQSWWEEMVTPEDERSNQIPLGRAKR